MAVKMRKARLVVKSPDGQFCKAVLHNIPHYPSSFTNLVSSTCFQRKNFYLDRCSKTINWIGDNFQLPYTQSRIVIIFYRQYVGLDMQQRRENTHLLNLEIGVFVIPVEPTSSVFLIHKQ